MDDSQSLSNPETSDLQNRYTKATLFMALLRAVGIPCRFHGFTIYKDLQKGALTPFAFLDTEYLNSIQRTVAECTISFCGYGIATKNLQNPGVEWTGGNTFIQKEGIARDLGLFDSPDDFYKKHGANAKGLKKAVFSYFIRHSINKNVERIRKAGLPQGEISHRLNGKI